jgi:2-deoxy-D-gluconate 3-dehydrogenase
MILFDPTGRVAIVTGGNGGIGLGMATSLRHAGASVVIAGRNKEKSAKATALLGARAIEVDVANEASVRSLVDQTVHAFGRVDILINNAGIAIRKQPETYTLDEWREVLDINLTSAFLCSQAVYPHMVKAGGGKIINVGSMLSIFGMPLAMPYGASKGGIVQMGDLLPLLGERTIFKSTRSYPDGSTRISPRSHTDRRLKRTCYDPDTSETLGLAG